MAENLLSPPRILGTVRESSLYRTLGVGSTQTIFLLGHADGLAINDPYPVVNIREAINAMNADVNSPLLRAMLEAYYAGARDIYVVAVAPMNEYYYTNEAGVKVWMSDISKRLDAQFASESSSELLTEIGETLIDEEGEILVTDDTRITFYERYFQRLNDAYEVLKDWDAADIMVPVEAPFYDTHSVDFLTQLSGHCQDKFDVTGSVTIGIIGTRVQDFNLTDINALSADTRFTTPMRGGMFIMTVLGEGFYSLPQYPNTAPSSAAVHVAANLAIQQPGTSLTYSRLGNFADIIGLNLTKDQISSLINNKINPVIRTQKAKRGVSFQTVLATDNTLASNGSDFWSVLTTNLIGRCIKVIKAYGRAYIGSIDFNGFKTDVSNYLRNLVAIGLIRNYSLDVARPDDDPNSVTVNVSLSPFMGVRQVSFMVEVGPGV